MNLNMDVVANATSLKAIMTQFAPEQIRMIEGTVASEDPLKIQAANDEKLLIPAGLLIVPQHLTDWKEEVVISTDAYKEKDIPVEDASPFEREPKPHRGSCTVTTRCGNSECSVSSSCSQGECTITPCAEHHYKSNWIIHKNHLRTGETVILLAFSGGSKYLVLDRKAGEAAV